MKQQTTVEWLYNLSKQRELDKFDLVQAKQMEEDQLFEFWNGGINSTDEGGKSFDQFYETYNK